ncbi:MAG: hypothetical protein M1839_005522 [Geoglossum umbratile]|nr:MAG: hypothetical protein M1839_005522 [Geoglossum umbratile]
MDNFALVRNASPTLQEGSRDADLDIKYPGEWLLYGGKLNVEAEICAQNEAQLSGPDTSKDGSYRRNAFSTSLIRRIGVKSLGLSIFYTIVLLAVSVTVSPLLIRFSVSSLAIIVTSMIASITIESRGIPLEDSAKVLLARFSNRGPITFWRSLSPKSFRNEFPLSLLIAAMLATTIATQLGSTLLLADLGKGPVVDFPVEGTGASGLTYSSLNLPGGPNPDSPLFFEPKYWMHAPTTFETFAEFSWPHKLSGGIDDTNVTLRSFLPIGDQKSRETLEDFTESASVFDLRVVCVRPSVTSLGIHPGEPPHPIWQNVTSDGSKGSVWLLCFLGPYAGGLIPALDPTNNQSLTHAWNSSVSTTRVSTKIYRDGNWVAQNGSSAWHIDLGQAYIVMNASESNNTTNRSLLWTLEASGPRTHVKYSFDSSEENYFRMSICYDSLPIPVSAATIQEFDVATASSRSRQEPIALAFSNTTTYVLDTMAIRKQLGAFKGKSVAEDRGIWNLTSADAILDKIAQLRKTWKSPQNPLDIITFNTSNASTYPWVIPMILDDLSSIALCPKCSHNNIRQGSSVLIAVFKDVLEETDSPALALQDILTIVLRMAYYDWVPIFNANFSSSTTSLQQALVPLHHKGLWAVISILALRVVLCLLTAYAFIAYSRQSLLNNSWQTIAQLSNNPEVSANMATDCEIEERIHAHDELRRRRFRLGSVTGENAGVLVREKI